MSVTQSIRDYVLNTKISRGITQIAVHYSATYADQNLTVKDIDRMHRQRGFDGVGYHFVVRRDGVIEVGRPIEKAGAHVSGHNSNSIGICGIGGLERATGPDKGVKNWTPEQEASILSLIDLIRERFQKAEVLGHRDFKGAATQCPGFDVRPWYQVHLRKRFSDSVAETASNPVTIGDVRDIVNKAVQEILTAIRSKG